MEIKEAIEFLEWLSENTPYTIKYQTGEDFSEIAEILQDNERTIIDLEEEIEKLCGEGRLVGAENKELREEIRDIKDTLFDIWKEKL